MSLLTPGPTRASVDGGWLATITRVDSAGPYVTAPRLQRGYEYGPCQAPALTPGEPPYTPGDRVIVNTYEGRPDELIIVARTTAVAPSTTPPPGPHEHDAADVTTGVLDPERVPPLEQLTGNLTTDQIDGTLAATQVPALSALLGTLTLEQLPPIDYDDLIGDVDLDDLSQGVRDIIIPPATAGSWGGVFDSRFNVATAIIEWSGTEVELSGAITTKVAVPLATGTNYTVGTINPPPKYNKHVEVPTQAGSLELLILGGTGVVSLRNWSGVTRNLAVGHFIGLGGLRYRIAL